MFGKNPKRPPELGNGSFLKIQKIFLTIQGEGPLSGTPAIFIRLGGCNLACSFCDTEFESFEELGLDIIIERVRGLSYKIPVNLVVITGGEPFRQTIGPLCEKLLEIGFKIQIECNGTLYNKIPKEVEIVCSPKVTNNNYHKIRQEIESHLIAYKFLVSNNYDGYGDIPNWNFNGIKVYIQPIDENDKNKNSENTKLALDIAIKKGYIFSLQIHKAIGID